MSVTKKPRQMIPEKIYDTLLGLRPADMATIQFKDGRSLYGAVVFNQFKGTGRIINVDQELSEDFSVEQIRDLKLS